MNLGGIQINNRVIRSGTTDITGDSSGRATEKLVELYKDLSDGNIGLIISGGAEVVPGTVTYGVMKICDDSYTQDIKTLADLAHSKGNKIILQIMHQGSQIFGHIDYEPFSPSGIEDEGARIKSREMSKEDIKKLVEDFGDGALRAKNAGFDGVQIHAAHGYLLSRFLTPYYNRRNDEYGGSIENRARIILEVYENIRKKCGDDFPVFIKINASDYLEEGGLTFEDSKKVMMMLSDAGINAIEVSGGINTRKITAVRPGIKTREDEGYHKELASEIAKEISTPVIAVGGFRSLDVIEEVIEKTDIEAVSMGRPFLAEPKLVARWIGENAEKSKCTSCNKCLYPSGTRCILDKK